MYNHIQFPKISLLSNVSTKLLGRRGMDRSDKETLNNVPNTPVHRWKTITS